MFGKSESEVREPTIAPAKPSASGASSSRGQASVGSSISIKGDLVGEEDLAVHGSLEGTITLKQNSLLIGKDGRIKADLRARIITVEGHVVGGLYGTEQVIIKKSGVVQGNIQAPTVALEDGCKFKGSIEMDIGGKSSDTTVINKPSANQAANK